MQTLVNILTFPLTLLYWIVFFAILIVFHGLQWIAHNVFGYQAHKKVVDVMNLCLVSAFLLVGVRYKVTGNSDLDASVPTIIVSNHQSMFDVPPMIWFLRKLHPKFIAKKELAKGVPGISYNLRHGGSILIDRTNRNAAVESIVQMGKYISEHNRSVVIFPEGTRSKTGTPLKWHFGGIITLLEKVPNAQVIPVTIMGSWSILQHGGFPIPFGKRIEMRVHSAMRYSGSDPGAFVNEIKAIVEAPLARS